MNEQEAKEWATKGLLERNPKLISMMEHFGDTDNPIYQIAKKIEETVEEKESKIYECQICGIKLTSDIKPEKCSCGSSNLILYANSFNNVETELSNKNFEDKNLLNNVLSELSKDHLGDNNLKMTTFLCDVSGLLKNPKHRKSIAIKADSSTGKDNLIKTCLKHMPEEACIFVTSATQATIEDDIKDKRIIAFSEVNRDKNREAGANKYLTEVIKQKAEGGTSSIKKDIRKGMKEARYDVGEQATINYGTIETESDEELGTRFIEGNIKTDYQKIKKVNENTLDTFSDAEKLFQEDNTRASWIKIGLTKFFTSPIQYDVIIPYAKFLKEQINGQDIFDNSSPRSQRDLKRVLALTCATTYLSQKQRKVIEHKGIKILVSEPQDLINTLKFSAEFFNQSYSGLDARLNEVLKVMNEFLEDWVGRDNIQTKLNVSRATIKKYCETLADEGLIEGINGSKLNQEKETTIYNGNKIYYKRQQKAIKKPLIRHHLSELKKFLEEKTNTDLTPFCIDDINLLIDDKKPSEKKPSNEDEGIKESKKSENNQDITKNDAFKLMPSYCGSEFTEDNNIFLCGQMWKEERKICSKCKIQGAVQ